MTRPEAVFGSPLVVMRRYSAFASESLPKVTSRVVRLNVLQDGRVVLTEVVQYAEHRDKHDSPLRWVFYSEHGMQLVGSPEVKALGLSVASGAASFGILADWIEDDLGRVRSVDGHRRSDLLASPNPVAHMLAVMRAHRPGKKVVRAAREIKRTGKRRKPPFQVTGRPFTAEFA